jgi:hypothetical protein
MPGKRLSSDNDDVRSFVSNQYRQEFLDLLSLQLSIITKRSDVRCGFEMRDQESPHGDARMAESEPVTALQRLGRYRRQCAHRITQFSQATQEVGR